MSKKSWEDRLWKAIPYVMALTSLVGFVFILVNPFCYCSTSECMGHCEFAPGDAWKSYLGKAAGLQFFATGFLAAAAVLSWPVLRVQIFRCIGQQGEELMKFCLTLGHFVLLFGIWTDMHSENPMLAWQIAAAFVVSIAILGWVLILSAGWIIGWLMICLWKKLISLLQCVLAWLCTYVRCTRPPKPP